MTTARRDDARSTTGKRKRTPSQQFAEDQLLAAIEAHEGHVYIMATDWGTWRDKWFITPRRAAEAACRLAADDLVRIRRHPALIRVELVARP